MHLRARALGNYGDPPKNQGNNNVFRHDNDMSDRFRRTTANATETLSFQPSIRACECNGVKCTTEEKKPGDTIKICLWSNFLDIQSVSQISLRLGNFTYQPIVDGTANTVTNVALNGRLAIVTTMLISAFFQDTTYSPSNLQVQGQVSFVPHLGSNRYLTDDASSVNISRSLTMQEKPVYILIVASVLFVIVTIAAALGALIAKGHICFCLSRQPDEKEGPHATYIQKTRV